MVVNIKLDIDDDPDKEIIKKILEAGFKGEDTIFVTFPKVSVD